MRENTISALIIAGILILVGTLWLVYQNPALNPRLQEETYTIIRKWDVPEELEEISGITYIGDNKIACVQDEEGIIFIYNLDTDLVDRKINFAKSGDYEGIAVADSTAYVIESNGKLHEIENYLSPSFTERIIKTQFSGRNNMESLALDSLNHRLLLTVKDHDPNSKNYKGIYAFDLESQKISTEPIFMIRHDDPIFMTGKKGDLQEFYPSELAINPVDGNIYVLEGKNPRLLILDSKGTPIKLHKLNSKTFPQPEGMTFGTDGTLYISNEGKNGIANILEVELKKE